MKSKLGFHIDIQGHHGQVEKMIRAGTRVIKVITSMGMLRDLHHALGDKTVFIARDWRAGDDFLRFGGADDPQDAARRWLDAMRPSLVQAPFAYWESFNEMSNWDYLRQYGEFEAERQRLMAAEGFKACIGNFSTGSPPIKESADDTTREDYWPAFYPALQAAHELNNLLGLHEYGGLWMDLWYGPNQSAQLRSGNRVALPDTYAEGWLFGRYRKVWRRHIQPNGWTNIRIVLTEFGLDMAGTVDTTPLAGYTVGSWTTCAPAWRRLDGRSDTEQYYVEQLQWADRQMQKDAYVIGATIFTWGTLGTLWRDFEIEGEVAEKLIAYIQSTRDEPGSDAGTGMAVPTIFLTPIPVEGLRVRQGPGTQYRVIAIVHPGDKLGALDTDADVASKLGRDGQWLKIRTPEGQEGHVAAWLVERFGAPPVSKPDEEKVYVTPIQGTGVFLWEGPGTQYPKLETLYMGDLLELLDPQPDAIRSIGRAGSWLKVRTPRGRNGWVEARVVQRAYLGPHEDKPPVEQGPLYLRTTSETGQYVRSGQGTHYPPIASVFPWDRLEVVGSPAAARALVGQRGKWIQVRIPSGLVGWAGSYYLEIMPPYYVWPGGHALVGLHGPADPGEWPWDEEAFLVIRKARIQAVKLLAAGDIGSRVVNRLRQEGVVFIMARLFAKFNEPRTPQSFVAEVGDAVVRLYNNGVRYFEVHNEPNLHTPDSPEGMWVAWQNGREFGQFFLDAVALLKNLTPGAQFGFPGVSPGPDEPGVRMSSEAFLAQADSAIRRADFVCMHTYWGADGSTYMDSIRKVRAFCDRYPNKLVFVTEFSNTHPQVGKDLKGREYARLYSEARKLPPNLGALFSYVLSALTGYEGERWKGSPIPDLVGQRTPL